MKFQSTGKSVSINTKPRIFILFTMFTLLALNTGFADEIIIGTGTTGSRQMPTTTNWDFSYTQQIYLQSEINAAEAVNIDSISFYWADGRDKTRSITVYMANTAKTSFASNSEYVPLVSLTQVYTGDYILTTTNGWYTIVFDTPFLYNNSDNLLIAFDDNTGDWSSITNDFYCTPYSVFRSINFYQDGTINPATINTSYAA